MTIRQLQLFPVLAFFAACGTASGPDEVRPAAGPEVRVWVGETEWRPVSNLAQYGPNDPVYTVAVDEEGSASVTFGDGIHGARLPSGSRVRTTYRYGSGERGPLTISVERTVGTDASLPTCLRLDMERARFAFRTCGEAEDR